MADNLEWVTAIENVKHAINELGFNQREENNANARAIIGRDKNTLEIIYSFPAVIAAGRYFANSNEQRAKHIQTLICSAINHKHGKKTYKGCIWEYAD